MTWNIHDAELADTLRNERVARANRTRQCWIRSCRNPGAEKIAVPTARGPVESHWYCEHHSPLIRQHVRVLTRILQIPARG